MTIRKLAWHCRAGVPNSKSSGQSSINFGTAIILLSTRHRMADKQEMPQHVALYKQVKRLAMGEHPLSKYVPPLLLLADALLTSLIISRVACEFSLCYFALEVELTWVCNRYRDRLESIHGAD
jgi:hypothetical protein